MRGSTVGRRAARERPARRDGGVPQIDSGRIFGGVFERGERARPTIRLAAAREGPGLVQKRCAELLAGTALRRLRAPAQSGLLPGPLFRPAALRLLKPERREGQQRREDGDPDDLGRAPRAVLDPVGATDRPARRGGR